MAEENNDLVNLGDLGTATPEEINKALEGQPQTVKAVDTPEPTKPRYLNLGSFNSNLVTDKDGNMDFVNPYSPYMGVDFDQFETRRRRVSETNPLSGILNGVEGLEENFQYTGMQSTINRSEEAQGVVNKMKNGFTQLLTDTSINVGQGFASLLYGVPSAIVNGDLTKLYDNAVANSMDRGTEFLDEFYEIKRGGNQSGMQKASNFLFDDVFGGASFVMGAIATELIFSGLTAASGGAAAPAQAAATAGLVARGTRLANKALSGGKWLLTGGMVDDALRGASQLTGQATRQAAGDALRAAGQAAAGPKSMHAALRVGRQLITGAAMESGMEARHMLNAAVEEQKRQYEDMNGEGSYTEAMAEDFRNEISGYGDGVFGLNMALVGASNMLMFPKLFGVGVRSGMRTNNFIDTSTLSAKARERLAKNLGVEVGQLPKIVDAARGNVFGRITGSGGVVGRTAARNMGNAFYEGFVEEGGQGAISRTAEDYIAKRYDPRGMSDTLNFSDSFLEGLKGSYTTHDGFKEIGLGMLLAFTGVPMYTRTRTAEGDAKWGFQMMGGYADQRARLLAEDEKMNAIIALSEKNGDVNAILKAEIENMNRQNVLAKEQDIAAGEGNFKRAKDIESDMIFSHAASKIVTGRYEQALGEAGQVLEEMSEEELREQLGSAAKNMTDEEVRAHRTKVYDGYKQRMERARKAYEQAGEVYRGTDPDIHTGVAHMLFNAEELDAREKRVAEMMAENIEEFTQGEVLDVVKAQAELNMTQKDVDTLLGKARRIAAIDKTLETRKAKGLIENIDQDKAKQRKDDIAALETERQGLEEEIAAMQEVMATAANVDRNKYDFNPDFLEKLRKLHAAVSSQNRESVYRGEDIQAMYEDLMDLASDRFKVIAEYNDFIQPGGVARFEQRMIGSIERLSKLTPEEEVEARQLNAEEQDVAEIIAEDTNEKSPQAQDTYDYTPPVGRVNPNDNFGVPNELDTEIEMGTPNLGFPEADIEDGTGVEEVPANMRLQGEQQQTPAPEQAAQTETQSNAPVRPAISAYGKLSLNLVNSRNGNTLIKPGTEGVLAMIMEGGMPAGTRLRARLYDAERQLYNIELPDGTVVARANGRTSPMPEGMLEAMLVNNGVIDIVTTGEVEVGSTGGELIGSMNKTTGVVEYLIEPAARRLANVLPNGKNDIAGAVVMGDELIYRVGGIQAPAKNLLNHDPRYSGDVYIYTKDAKTGTIAYHNVQLDNFNKSRADQLMDFVDAFNLYIQDRNAVGGTQKALIDSFLKASGISNTLPNSDMAKAVYGRLQRTIPSSSTEVQKNKLIAAKRNGVKMRPLFSVVLSKDNTINIVTQQQDQKPLYAFLNGERVAQSHAQIKTQLANHRINLIKEDDVTVLPDGNGNFEGKRQIDLLMESGSFHNYQPFVVNGKVYNSKPLSVNYKFTPLVQVPTDEPSITSTETPTSAPIAGSQSLADGFLQVDLGTIEDIGEIDFLPQLGAVESAENPMDRAGALYDIPGLKPAQIRDGVNFGSGVMARAMLIHMRTKKRTTSVSPEYLRNKFETTIKAQLSSLQQRPQSPMRDAMIAAHEAWLKPENFNRLADLSMLDLLQAKDSIVQLRRGDIESALGRLSDESYTAEQEDENDAAERNENPLAAFDDNFAFGIDPKSTLRLESKLLLLTLQHKISDVNPATVSTFGLAGPRFINFSDLNSKLNASLANVRPEWSVVKARMEQMVDTYPEFQTVIDALSDEAALDTVPEDVPNRENVVRNALEIQDMIRNQFVVYATKVPTTRDSIRLMQERVDIRTNEINQAADIEIYNSNQRNMRQHVRDDIRSILIQHRFFTADGKLNKEKFNSVVNQMDAIAEMVAADRTKALAAMLSKEFGIVVPVQALSSNNTTANRRGKRLFQNIESALAKPVADTNAYGRLYNAFKKVTRDQMSLEDMLTDTDKKGGRDVVDFFSALANYRENFIQNSSKDGDNKTIHHYSAPKLLHHMFDEVVYGNRANVLKPRIDAMIDNTTLEPTDYRSEAEITYISGIKLENRGKERDFHGMEPGDLALAKLALYGNRGKTSMDAKGQLSGFLMPTLADKHTMPIVRLKALRFGRDVKFVPNLAALDKPMSEIAIGDVIGNLENAYDITMRSAVDVEINRMLRLDAGDYEGMTAAQRDAYAFVMFPSLNGLATQLKEKKISRAEFKKRAHEKAFELWKANATKDLQELIADTEDVAWSRTEQGGWGKITYFNANAQNFKWIRKHLNIEVADNESLSSAQVQLAFIGYLAKYAIDSMSVRTGLVMDMMGDPGAFVKVDRKGRVNVAKTATNLGKRFASLIAPGSAIPYVSWDIGNGQLANNHRVKTLVLPARIVDKAAHYEFLEKLGQSPEELSMQEGYDSADAAEYTTAQEHLSILYAQGKLTRREMMGIMGKIRQQEKVADAYAKAETAEEKKELMEKMEELRIDAPIGWFQPMKPVTSGRVGDHMLYVKSASFPLLPQFTIGTEIDKLRRFMEKNNIDRAAYDSAVKLGNEWADAKDTRWSEDLRMLSVHNGAEVVIPEGLENRVIEYDRRYMRIQQEVPVGELKEKVHGSQVAKLLLVDLADSSFELNGQKLTGRELYGHYMTARNKEQEARLQRFAERYEMSYDKRTGRAIHTDASRKKFAERIMEEAVARKYDTNELAHLYFDEKTGRFTTPLIAGPSADRIENLIKSIIFKEIYEPRILGFSGPIRPEVGLGTMSEIMSLQNDITWVKRGGKTIWDGKKLRVAQNGKPDQILMPWKYKQSLKPYMDENGNINAEDLPAELLRTMAYRIPGQRKSSSAAFEIVGFLPATMGDTLIVPEELVGRIGQDYDIDKMFGFLYSIKEVDGKIEVVRDEESVDNRIASARNRQIDIYYASMTSTDENVQRAVHSPVTDGYAEQLAGHLDKTFDLLSMPMSESYNARKANAARSAKRTIGVMAVHNVLHAQLEQMLSLKDLTIDYNGSVFVEIGENRSSTKPIGRATLGSRDIHDNTFLFEYSVNGKKYVPKAGRKSDQFSRLLNHAVDNENNGLLDKLNINQDTWGIVTGMTHMGYNQETIALFVSMPVVKEFIKRKSRGRRLGTYGDTSINGMMQELLATMPEDLQEMVQDPKKLKASGLPMLNKQDMFNVVTGQSNLTRTESQVLDFQVLQAMAKLEVFGDNVQRVQTLMKLDTNRPKSLIGVFLMTASVDSILDNDLSSMALDLEAVKEEILKSTVAGSVTAVIARTAYDLFNLDGSLSKGLIKSLNKSVDKAELLGKPEEHIQTYLKGAKSYLYTRFLEKEFGVNPGEFRSEAHNAETGGIARKLMKLRESKVEVRNNSFVKQLIAVDKPGKYPHLEFTGDRELEQSSVDMHRGFLQLLKSTDPEVREFGEYLVKYALATSGGRLKSRGFLKYVPAEYFQSKGLGKYVNAESLELAADNSMVLNQIVRHNPELATKYSIRSEAYKTLFERKGKVLLMKEGAPSFKGYVMIGNQLYAPAGFETVNGVDFTVVKPVSILGDYLSDMYSTDQVPFDQKPPAIRTGVAASMANPAPPISVYNEAPPETGHENEAYYGEPNLTPPPGMSVGPETGNASTTPPAGMGLDMGGTGEVSVPKGYGLQTPPIGGNENAASIVNNQTVRNPNAQVTSGKLLDNLQKLGVNNPVVMRMLKADGEVHPDNPINLEIVDGSNISHYNRTTNTITLSRDMLTDNRTLIHETVHALTSLGLGIASGKIKAREGFDTEPVKAFADDIKELLDQATTPQALEAMGLKVSDLARVRRGYNAFLKHKTGVKLNEAQLSDVRFLLDNRDKYYGLVNVNEFIAEAFSNPQFAQQLTKVRGGEKSWYRRFIDKVAELLEALGMSKMTAGEKTLLRDVYVSTMGLVAASMEQSRNARNQAQNFERLRRVESGEGGMEEVEREMMRASMMPDPDAFETSAEYDAELARIKESKEWKDLDYLPQEVDIQAHAIKGLDSLKLYKEKRIRQFEELKSRYADNRAFVRRVHSRLVQEQKELDRLVDDSVEITPDYLLAIGQRELDFARRTIDSVNASDPQISEALSALQNIYSIIEFYDDAREILSDKMMKEHATALRREAAELRDNYLEKGRVILREAARREFATSGVEMNDTMFEKMMETGFVRSMFLDASRQGSTELSFLDKIVRDAAQKQRVEFNRRAAAWMPKSKAFKSSAYFKKHGGWKGLVELDAEGNPTAKIITMFSGRFEAIRTQKRNTLEPKEYFKWLRENTGRVDVDTMFDYSGEEVKRKNNPAYVKYLAGKFGVAGAEEVLRQQEAMLQNYVDAREAAFDNIDMTVPKEGRTQAKEDWVLKNSPANAYRRANGKGRNVKGQTSRYLIDFPLREIKGKSTGYYDSRYMELMEDKAAFEAYQEYRKQVKELGRMLPAHKLRGKEHLLENGLFIPAMSKTLSAEILEKGGYAQNVGKLTDSMKAALTIDPSMDINKLIDPITGRPRQELPTYYLGQLDPETQEYDMDRTLLGFAMMATTYDSKNMVEDKVKMVQSVLGHVSIERRDSLANRLMGKLAPDLRDDKARADIMRSVDTIVDTFYGYQETNDMTTKAPEKLWTTEQKAKIDELKEKLSNAQTDEAKAEIQRDIDAATPLLSGAKTVRGLQQFAQAKGMAWNVPAAVVNVIFGSLSVFKHASGRADFNEKAARKGMGIMLSSSLNMMTLNTGLTRTKEAEKIQNMMVNLDQLKDFTEMRYDVRKYAKQATESGVNASAQQGFNKLRMYEIQRSSEYFVYGAGTIAHLLSVEVDGKNLWDHMDQNGIIQLDGYRPGEAKHTELMNKLDQMNKRIHGNYDPSSPIAIKKTMLGPLLMQFRSWLPEAVASRYEDEKYDPYLNRTVKGTFRTMFNSGATGKHFKAMLPLLLPSYIRTKGMDMLPADISEVDQENIRKFAAGLRQWLNMYIIVLVLKAMKDDEDDEETRRLLNSGLNISHRVDNDLRLFGDPRALYDLTQGDYFAAVGLLSAAADFVEATANTIAGDPTIETGVYAGKNRMLHHGGKLIPHVNAIQRISNNALRELD